MDILHALGFCCSYKEVLMFERNASMESNVDLSECFQSESSFLKFAADNVDHNTCTLDGRNTFHGMGMIASISMGKFMAKEIPRKKVSDKELLTKSHVPIIHFNEKASLLKGIKFKTLQKKALTNFHENLLWTLTHFFKNPTPIWSGTMQLLHESSNKDQYQKDIILPLPIIDVDPTNMSCILSTLSFLANIAHTSD